MSCERVDAFLKNFSLPYTILTFEQSSATVQDAALAVGVEEGQIAKTITIKAKDDYLIVVCAGDQKIDNAKFKAAFDRRKPRFLGGDEMFALTGYLVGGMCPFDINFPVYLDQSLLKYDVVYPAAGTRSSAVRLSVQDLQKITNAQWVDVTTPISPK